MNLFDRFLDLCGKWALIIANLLLAAMLLMGFCNILIREIFGKGIIWVLPWTLVFFAWTIFLGYYIIFWKNCDVVLEFIVSRLGATGKKVCFNFSAVVIITLNAVIVSQAPKIIYLKSDNIEIIDMPSYLVTLPLFFSAFLIICLALSLLIRGRKEHRHYTQDHCAQDHCAQDHCAQDALAED